MKALILLGTLKKTGLSNTQTLSEFFAEHLRRRNVDCEILKLIDHPVFTGTYSDMGEGDAWPQILEKIKAAEIVLFASPVWWNNHSSEMQKVIERLDHLHDAILEGKPSAVEGKVAGVIITGDSDGAQTIIANISNFLNAIGMLMPPYCSLSVLWEGQQKGASTSREELLSKYKQDYDATAAKMAEQLIRYASQNIPPTAVH